MSNQNKNLWESFGGKGFSAEYAEYSECASSDVNGNDIVATYATKAELPTVNDAKLKLQLGSAAAADTGFTANADADATIDIPVMAGATAQEAGNEGLVPAPTTSDTDKFLKGDGTWDSPASADLTYYYYDAAHNGLSAKTSKSENASLVGTNGNLNDASIQAIFKLNWGGVVKELLTVDTLDENKSYLRFGGNVRSTAGQRYLLPRPTANKFAQTNSSGEIVWGDAPASVPTPSVDNSLLTGNSSGTIAWSQLATETYGELIDDGNGESHYADGSATLWGSFNSTGFGAERAVADQLGNTIDTTYATKAELPTVNDAKLKLQLGSGQATDTGFTANSSVDATITVPEMTGATASTAGASGIVPAPAVADKDKFLKGDGTWDTPIFDKNYSSVWGDSPSGVYGMFHVTVGRDQYGYSGSPRTLTQVGRNGVLGYLLPEPVEGTIPVSVKDAGNNKCYALKTLRQLGALTARDTYASGGTIYSLVISAPDKPASIFTYTDEGNRTFNYWGVPYNANGTTGQVLTFNSSSGPYWAMPANPLPTPTHDNELFVGMSDGTSSWKQLTTIGMSTQLLDENDDPILDELGNAIYDNQPTIWYKLDDRGFYAERALADSDGQEIKSTYSTLASTASAISAASQQLTQQMETGYQRKLILGRDNESVEPRREYIPQNNEYVVASVFLLTNNKITRLTPQPVADGHVFRFLCNVTGTTNECPNFGIEFDTIGSGSSTVEIYIQPNGARSAYLAHPSVSGGTTISAGKFYQITCCGTCWTIAEFTSSS